MNFAARNLVALALASCLVPTVAEAQVLVGGFEHFSVGSAQLGTAQPGTRRLPVTNLGSSGQDGVEISLNTAWGAGVAVGGEPFTSTPGAEIRRRYRGWDGVVYGTHRTRNIDGNNGVEIFDFSDQGVTSFTVFTFDDNGDVVSTSTEPGPLIEFPVVNRPINCPCGWVTIYYWVTTGNPPKPHLVSRGYCPCSSGTGLPPRDNRDSTTRVICPEFPPGVRPPEGIASVLVTASGIPEFTLEGADLTTFDTHTVGLGGARIDEVCDLTTGCDATERRLRASGLGSSGNDGIDVGFHRASSVSFQMDNPADGQLDVSYAFHQGPTGRALSMSSSSGQTTLSCDTTMFSGCDITVTTWLDGNPTGGGNPTSPQGYLINTNTLDWILRHPLLQFTSDLRVLTISGLSEGGAPLPVTLSSNGQSQTAIADTITIEFLTGQLPPLEAFSITARDITAREFSISSIIHTPATPACVADLDDGSGSGIPDGGVGIEDLLFYLSLFESGLPRADVDDGSGSGIPDGGVGIEDLLYYLVRFEAGC
jgi:hypothetical protein